MPSCTRTTGAIRARRRDHELTWIEFDEVDHHLCRRSSSARAKYAEANRRISLARFSSRTSRSRPLSCSRSDASICLVVPSSQFSQFWEPLGNPGRLTAEPNAQQRSRTRNPHRVFRRHCPQRSMRARSPAGRPTFRWECPAETPPSSSRLARLRARMPPEWTQRPRVTCATSTSHRSTRTP